MAIENTASIIPLHQPQKPKPALSAAERARNYRIRKRQKADTAEAVEAPIVTAPAVTPRVTAPVTSRVMPVTEIVTAIVTEDVTPTVTAPVTAPVTSPVTRPIAVPVAASRVAPWLLTVAAFGLAAVGVTMNGWFARSLGSSDIAGWLFLAIGVAADMVALAVPSCAARLWEARQRLTAALSWGIWSMTFAFALTAGIGFASVNLTDVTLARAARVTPAVETARADLADAMASRDRECKGGVGKVCREREQTVIDRRAGLDAAMRTVEKSADPQTEAASRMVAWLTRGLFQPSGDDFGMLRLMLLAILPQIGGVLLMIARGGRA